MTAWTACPASSTLKLSLTHYTRRLKKKVTGKLLVLRLAQRLPGDAVECAVALFVQKPACAAHTTGAPLQSRACPQACTPAPLHAASAGPIGADARKPSTAHSGSWKNDISTGRERS